MYKMILFSFCIIFIFSCKKEKLSETVPPVKQDYNISHFDWEPDSTIIDSVKLDLNKDGAFDLKFRLITTLQGSTPSGGPYYNFRSEVYSLDSNLFITLGKIIPPGTSNFWNCLAEGEIIGGNLTWNRGYILNHFVATVGNVAAWDKNLNQGYIGLKFINGQNVNWGWININSSTHQVILKEYVINQNNNQIIKVGQIE